jgi:hypothetical protein
MPRANDGLTSLYLAGFLVSLATTRRMFIDRLVLDSRGQDDTLLGFVNMGPVKVDLLILRTMISSHGIFPRDRFSNISQCS